MVRCTSRSRSSIRSVCVNIFWDTPPIARRSSPCRRVPPDSSYRTSSPHLVQILVKISWTSTTRRLGALGAILGCTSRQGTYLNRGLPSDYIALSRRDQPGGDSRRAGGIMVELILSESQLACL